MNFFQELFSINPNVALTIRVMAKNDKLTISIAPDTADKVQALVITGTPAWLDENLIKEITKPMEELNAVLNAKEFAKDVQKLGKKPAVKAKASAKPDTETDEAVEEEDTEEADEEKKPAKKKTPPAKKVVEKPGPTTPSFF